MDQMDTDNDNIVLSNCSDEPSTEDDFNIIKEG